MMYVTYLLKFFGNFPASCVTSLALSHDCPNDSDLISKDEVDFYFTLSDLLSNFESDAII